MPCGGEAISPTELTLGGVEQWVVMRGRSAANPILLDLHGGPGGDLGAFQKLLPQLEERFLVVYWVQRGSSKSFSSGMTAESLTLEQFVADIRELVVRLLKRFDQEKVIVVGQLWGTGFGVEFVQQYPELVRAYVGVNQTVDRAAEEERTYGLILAEARRRGKRKAIRRLEEIGRPQGGLYRTMDDFYYTRSLTKNWRMISYLPSGLKQWGMGVFFAPEVGWSDVVRFIRGTILSMPALWPKFCRYNDAYMSADLAEQWLGQLRAPIKELIVFDAGHLACYEDPARFSNIVLSRVLQ